MTSFKKQSIAKISFVVIILMIITMNAFSRILQNGSGTGYEEGDGDASLTCMAGIESYIIQGAGYFLEGQSDIQLFLQQVELQDFTGIDYDLLLQVASPALANITLARMTYDRLVGLAEATPYNQGVIVKLKAFDYDGFMTQNGLNAVVFTKLRDYLAMGDITGSLKHTRDNLAAIEALLVSVVQKLSLHQLPELTMTWELNETCAYTSLFGSYAARIFQSLD